MGLWANGLAWAVSIFMGLQSGIFYACASWLGVLIGARGVSLRDVGADLTVFYLTQFMAALITPVLVTKTRRQDILAAFVVAANGALIVGIFYGPPATIFAFCAMLGFAMGAMFAVALTFAVIRARTADGAARLSSMALCVGYLIASLGPLVLGLVNHGPNARLASAAWLLLLIIFTIVSSALAGRQRFVD
jgi:CP family cyanate transporter-like MFS transporter